MTQKEITQCTRDIKDEMAKLAHSIETLEKFANKVISPLHIIFRKIHFHPFGIFLIIVMQ